MMGGELCVPVSPDHCTVLGYRVKADNPMWTGLYFDKAEVRDKASVFVVICGYKDAPVDLHLDVPWQHPEDREQFGIDTNDCFYRVRSRYEIGRRYRFELEGRPHFRTVETIAFRRGDSKSGWELVLGLRPSPTLSQEKSRGE